MPEPALFGLAQYEKKNHKTEKKTPRFFLYVKYCKELLWDETGYKKTEL